MTDAPRFDLGVGILPIPDGLDRQRRLRLSLIIGVDNDPAVLKRADLAHWPAAIAALAGAQPGAPAPGLKLMFYGTDRKPLHSRPLDNYELHPSIRMADVRAGADRIWADMFPPDELQILHQYLLGRKSLQKADKLALASTVRDYRAARTIDRITEMRAVCIASTFMVRAIADEHRAAWRSGVRPAAKGRQMQAYADASTPFRFQMDRNFLNALSSLVAGRPPAEQQVPLPAGNKTVWLPVWQLNDIDQTDRVRAYLKELKADFDENRFAAPEESLPDALTAARDFIKLQNASPRKAVEALLLDEEPEERPRGNAPPDIEMPGARTRLSTLFSMAATEFLNTFGPARPPQTFVYKTLDETARQAADEEERIKDIAAKFTGIQARPTLAKMLNFIVDITVPVPRAPNGSFPRHGYVQVYFAGESPDNAALVAFAYADAAHEFRPRSVKEAARAAASAPTAALGLPLKNGLVDLDPARFTASCVDVHSLINSSRVRLQELYQADLNAGDSRDNSPRLMEERGRGIQLIDNGAMKAEMARQLQDSKRGRAFIHAEELVTGYRVFVRRQMPGKGPGKWRTLMARRVHYDPIRREYAGRLDGERRSWQPYDEFHEREHGTIKPVPRIGPPQPGMEKPLVPPSHLFTWLGESLGVPAGDGGKLLSCEESERERRRVGIGITYDYPRGETYRVPALRIDNSYEFALAPVYLHGGGPVLEHVAAVTNARLAATLSARFSRPNDVQAPLMLVAPDDRLFSHRSRHPNEHIDRVVLRSGAGQDTRHAQRFLVPPRIDFTSAEQYGLLDASDRDKPYGAFRQFSQDKESGDFVQKKTHGGDKSQLYVLQASSGAAPEVGYFPDPLARNLGVAFERNDKVPAGFPDRVPTLSFWPAHRHGDFRACLKAVPIELALRRWDGQQRGADIVAEDLGGTTPGPRLSIPRLTIRLAPAEEASLWTWCWPDLLDLARTRPELTTMMFAAFIRSGHKLATKMIRGVKSARGTSEPPPARGLLQAMVVDGTLVEDQAQTTAWIMQRLLSSPDARNVDQPASSTELERAIAEMLSGAERILFQYLPLNGVTGWRKIQLVHAVAKPRWIPQAPLQGNHRSIVAFRLLPGVTIAQHLAQLAKVGNAELHDSDQQGGNRIAFAGSLLFDRASTGSVRVEGNWPQLDHALAIRKEPGPGGGEHYVDRPPRADQVLFELRDIPRDAGNADEDVLDLLRDETGKLRELFSQSQSSGTAATAARRINLRIVATSRFTNDFLDDEVRPDAPERGAEVLGKFEVESRPYLRNTAAAPDTSTAQIEILLKATVRPPPPVVTRYEFIAPEQRLRVSDDHLIVRKHYFPRLYLDESWRVSGPDELLAIAFAPAGAIRHQPYDPAQPASELGSGPLEPSAVLDPHYADELARFLARPDDVGLLPKLDCAKPDPSPLCTSPTRDDLAFVTRWGADPTAKPTGRMEALISPDRFSGHCASLSTISMPLPATPSGDPPPKARLAVGVLLYKPQLEDSTGRWYVDIGIDAGPSHAPFVRLALARYQPDAIAGCEMSAPLLLDPLRIPAPRTVEVRHPAGKPIVASVYGAGYLRRAPYGVVQALRHLTDMPLQSMELMRMADTAPQGWLQAQGLDGVPLKNGMVQPVPFGPMLYWRYQFEPPPANRKQNYALVIDEIEMHVPDSEFDDTNAKKESGASKSKAIPQLVAKPGYFSLTVEI